MKLNMKRIITAILLLPFTVSCSITYWDESFGGYDDKGIEYVRYNNDIVEYCLTRPMTVKQYVDELYKVGDIKPVDGSSYVFKDEKGNQIGPLRCTISGKDTTWTYGEYSYVMNRYSGGGTGWEVSRKDQEGGNSRFRYVFTMKVRSMDDKTGALDVSLSGFRYEDSEYYLSYCTEDGFRMVPEASGSGNFTKAGTILLEFWKDGKKLDWLKTTYLEGGSVQYESSFD